MRKIDIFDTTLRDGLQPPEIQPLNPRQKLEIARHLAELKVDVIEAGFPANESQRETVKMIADEVVGPTICALARCVEQDIDIAWDCIKNNLLPRIHVFAATSDIHIESKYKTTRDKVLSIVEMGVKRAKKYGCQVEFSPEDATRSDFAYLVKVIKLAIDCGASVINIPDTVGYALTSRFCNLIADLINEIPALGKEVVLSVHCHNDLGNAVSNSLIAVENGANQVECTINGIGERAGNAALEAVVMSIKTRSDVLDAYTDINTKKITKTSNLVSKLTGFPVQPNWPITGANAFRHSSGIHGHGVIQNRETYEIMNPKDVGIEESKLVLGSTSGRHMVEDALSQMGYALSDKEFYKVYVRFEKLAAVKPSISSEDLEAIVFDELSSKNGAAFVIDSIKYNSKPWAKVGLLKVRTGELFIGESKGDGTFDAIVKAINKSLGWAKKNISIVGYNINMVGKGSDAPADAFIRVRIDQQEFSARGLDTDSIRAATKAYVNILNQCIVDK